MPKQQAIITISDMDNGSVSVQSQFLPEIKGPVMSRAVAMWDTLMKAVKDESRSGDWMTTFSARKFVPSNPNPEDIYIEDIAHQLSNICRFGAATKKFYSVAQHCLHVSRLVPDELALLALMHDAPEAYIGDMVHPIKMAMSKFRSIERVIWIAVATKFGLPEEDPGENRTIKHADIKACMTERRDLLNQSDHKWHDEYENTLPDGPVILPLSPELSESKFLERFRELTSE